LADFGAFSTVLWHGNDFQDLSPPNDYKDQIMRYLDYGGNFLYTGYRPGKAFEQASGNPVIFGPGDFIYDYLKIEETAYKIIVLFSGANQIEIGYNNIFIDSLKTNPVNDYHLRHIESTAASISGTNIYSFETLFDSTTTQGSFKGKPVGVEYIGTNYKTVTLSFPLYYMHLSEAKELTEFIMMDKFEEVMSIEEDEKVVPSEHNLSQNYPNPFNPTTIIKYSIPQESLVSLKIYNLIGEEVATLVGETQTIGNYKIEFNATALPSGVYFYKLQADSFVETKKMVLMK
jgi:hypothetical protein